MLFPRTVARHAAVQIFYQHLFDKTCPLKDLLTHFHEWFVNEGMYDVFKDNCPEKIDVDFLKNLIDGLQVKSEFISPVLLSFLPKGWTLEKMEKTTWAILCCGAYEIESNKVPLPVILNEYINLAHNFLLEGGAGFVNGVLQAYANDHQARDKHKSQSTHEKDADQTKAYKEGDAEKEKHQKEICSHDAPSCLKAMADLTPKEDESVSK